MNVNSAISIMEKELATSAEELAKYQIAGYSHVLRLRETLLYTAAMSRLADEAYATESAEKLKSLYHKMADTMSMMPSLPLNVKSAFDSMILSANALAKTKSESGETRYIKAINSLKEISNEAMLTALEKIQSQLKDKKRWNRQMNASYRKAVKMIEKVEGLKARRVWVSRRSKKSKIAKAIIAIATTLMILGYLDIMIAKVLPALFKLDERHALTNPLMFPEVILITILVPLAGFAILYFNR